MVLYVSLLFDRGPKTVLIKQHTFQQSMLSKSTPILLYAISDFEIFMMEWETLRSDYKTLELWTEISLKWAKKYYIRMDKTDAYIVTMCKFLT